MKAFGNTPGGIITFGGGVPLYSGGKVIGGLGVSGDSACADHVIAYRMRREVGLDAIPAGVGFNGTDNIDYLATGEPPNGFKHPHCFPQDLQPGQFQHSAAIADGLGENDGSPALRPESGVPKLRFGTPLRPIVSKAGSCFRAGRPFGAMLQAARIASRATSSFVVRRSSRGSSRS